ncbi:MAG: PocR ligand-binding domain-containing protein [Bacillota bacterium]|nr:PocR ligand-binding domain-containing protein [Bacillota bacterium]
MIPDIKFKLKEIIDIVSLQNILDKFSEDAGLSSLILDEDGIQVVSSDSITNFCSLIKFSDEGYKRCINSHAYGCKLAIKSKEPVMYKCHAGLINIAAPIIVKDDYIGCAVCGQVRCETGKIKSDVNVNNLTKELCIEKQALDNALNDVPIINCKKLMSSESVLLLFCNYIAELGTKAVQMQINPQFLFNTLNAAARMALLEHAPNTEEFIYTFTELLRYSMKNANSMVTIDSEISNIKKYFYIQKMKHEDMFDYEIDVEPSILNYKIPIMTLQCSVENSIINVLNNTNKCRKIKIVGRKNDISQIILEIFDNAGGFEERTNAILQSADFNKRIKDYEIENANKRIIHFFGKEYGITVKMYKDYGTKTEIKIPCS